MPPAAKGVSRASERGSLFSGFCLRRPHFFQQRKKWGKERRQKPLVFGGVFAPFCRRGQKGVAPEREISPPEAKKRKQNIGGGRGRTPPLRRDRRECAGIRRCADAGRRGRRPLRGARPKTWRDTCGRGVPIGGVQTRDAGAGGVFRRTVIEWRRKPQNQHRRVLRSTSDMQICPI